MVSWCKGWHLLSGEVHKGTRAVRQGADGRRQRTRRHQVAGLPRNEERSYARTGRATKGNKEERRQPPRAPGIGRDRDNDSSERRVVPLAKPKPHRSPNVLPTKASRARLLLGRHHEASSFFLRVDRMGNAPRPRECSAKDFWP